MDANAECVFRSEGFLEIDFNLFEQIISRETLIAHERTVFEAAVKWAKAECTRLIDFLLHLYSPIIV